MSILQTKQGPPAEPTETVEHKFGRLAKDWLAGTTFVSSTSDLVSHPAFQEIVEMGPAVIPLLLRELANHTGQWHRALRRITGIDPTSAAERGNIDKAADAWLRWGKEQGYEW